MKTNMLFALLNVYYICLFFFQLFVFRIRAKLTRSIFIAHPQWPMEGGDEQLEPNLSADGTSLFTAFHSDNDSVQ